ncbi:MAG: hypothetical protein KJS74_08730, partial [Rhodospirillales bacterium]|nr:hypothetical protein [Rhodospirillales bacterium]
MKNDAITIKKLRSLQWRDVTAANVDLAIDIGRLKLRFCMFYPVYQAQADLIDPVRAAARTA